MREALCNGLLAGTLVGRFAVPIDGVVGLPLTSCFDVLFGELLYSGFKRKHLVFSASSFHQADFFVTDQTTVTLIEEFQASDASRGICSRWIRCLLIWRL